jgi:hypothetical protein
VDKHEIEIGLHPVDDLAAAPCIVGQDHDIANRTKHPWPRTARPCRFEQRFELEAESAPAEWKGFYHDSVGPYGVEGGKQRRPARSLQVLVDRSAAWTYEFLEASVTGLDRSKLNDARGSYRNGPPRRFSAHHKGDRNVLVCDGINQVQSALQVPDAEQVLDIK